MGSWIRIVTAVFVLVSGVSAAAQTGLPLVRGVVRDPSGAPVPGAVLRVVTPDSAVRVVSTDLRGEFVLHGPELGGGYTVHVSHPDYRKVTLEARPGDGPLQVNLTPKRKRDQKR